MAIASSLVLEPELLVADEPVSMLDVSVRAGILALLDTLRRSGLGILMITHDLSTAVHFADRIAVMYLGKIVEEGPARAVVATRTPVHPGAGLGRAAPRPARRRTRSCYRRDAERGAHPARLPLPPALPGAIAEPRDRPCSRASRRRVRSTRAACILAG